MNTDVPPFLTIEEAARLLRIGRTKAYAMAKEWRETGGRSGLPVVDLGDVLRVPLEGIEQMLRRGRQGVVAPPVEERAPRLRREPTPASPPAPVLPRSRCRRRQPSDQLALFEPPASV